MRTKILIIVIGGIIVIAGGVAATYLAGSSTQKQTAAQTSGQGSTLPVSGSSQTVTTGPGGSGQAGTTVIGAGGSAIPVSDFLHDPAVSEDPHNPGLYDVGFAADATSSPYAITYQADTQFFNIALLKEPIGPVREEMQQFLMTHLGIPQDQMCALNYMVSVPYWVNDTFTGRSLGFSFCPGAVTLPQ